MAILSPIRNVMNTKNKDVLLVLCFQLILLVLFGIFARYEDKDANFKLHVYPMFQDVHVMIFIGFGFLMTFLKRYGFSAVGFNFLLAAIVVQWAIICEGFYDLDSHNYKISINILSLLRADVASAAVLISMGAVLGNTSYIQLIIMGLIEVLVFSANSFLGSKILKVVDAGDSIFVHAFGAYFGLAVSYVLGRKQRGSAEVPENQLEGSSYTSDMFAMIGTVFLWMFWPSFNSAELEGDQQVRAIINTYLSLASCCVTAYMVSSVLTPNNKFDMVHIQNSTLAGGVAVGTSANMMLQPYGALIIGIVAGVLSVYGYTFITPFLNKTFNIHDTCGVHNLHGMPAVMAGLVGALMAGLANENDYHLKLYQVFPARASTEIIPGPQHPILTTGDGRTAGQQAGYQILAVVLTLIISIISGLITGFIIKSISSIKTQDAYADDISWQIHGTPESDIQEIVQHKIASVQTSVTLGSAQQVAADIEHLPTK